LGQRFYYYVFKNNLVYAVSFGLLRIIEFLLKPFSLRAKFSFGRLVGDLWFLADVVNRDLCRREMRLALGKTHSIVARHRALRHSMANIMAYHFEGYFSSHLYKGELLRRVSNTDWSEPLQKALGARKGAIVLTAHFSNFALLCYLISAYAPAGLIAKYQRIFNDIMVSHRRSMNLETLNEYETDYEMLLGRLSRNEVVLATIDRPLKRVKGINTRFFGHMVVVPYYFVDLARISGAPVFMALLTRNCDKYEMHFEGPFYVPGDADERESREKYCQQIYSLFEKYVSAHPHEWQWHHKRLIKKNWGVLRYPS
jgi:lauroyl/myristoyl acyltransferase